MSGVPRPCVPALTAVVCALMLSSCAADRFAHLRFLQTFPDPSPTPCHATGSNPAPSPGNSKSPIVCIDDRDMQNVKYPSVVHAEPNAVINWFTVTGQGSLSVVFNDKAPVSHLLCGQNKAYCQAVIDPQAPVGSYDYTFTVTRGGAKKSVDPTVQIDPGGVVWQTDYKTP